MYQVKDWITILDKTTNDMLAAGQVEKRKDHYKDKSDTLHVLNAVSIDSKWFFRKRKYSLYYIRQSYAIN